MTAIKTFLAVIGQGVRGLLKRLTAHSTGRYEPCKIKSVNSASVDEMKHHVKTRTGLEDEADISPGAPRQSVQRVAALVCVVLCIALAPAHGSEQGQCSEELTAKIRPRPPLALTGSQFARRVQRLDGRRRERLILRELLAGNLPQFLRSLEAVTLQYPSQDGKSVTAVLCMMPDYLAIGSDDDFLRMPMDLLTSTTVARRFGFILPTKKIVDAIYEQSRYRLEPKPLPPGPRMRSTAYYQMHNRKIRKQRREIGHPLGHLLTGHKKDLVITNRLAVRPNRVAIYGWHRRTGKPIQPLSTVHGARYADYSHGIRLVSEIVFIDGRRRSFYDVLDDPKLIRMLSEETVMSRIRRIMGFKS